jgi:uracil-DNA glycosylase family protein
LARVETTAAEFLPARITLSALRAAVQACRGCPLYCDATQAVFGEGEADAPMVLVGEQPGDEEDLAGHPFVGPAGRLLDRALRDAEIARGRVYVTNAVKHFKFRRRGKRRIHDKPTMYELRACRPWLEAELRLVEPRVLVLLGASAAQSLLGSKFRLTQHRGEPLDTPWAPVAFATIHPSAALRAPDSETRHALFDGLVADLRAAAAALAPK